MPRPLELSDWHLEAINLMARSGCSLTQAATELCIKCSHEEAATLLRRLSFQRLLWEARHRFFSQLGADPNWKKDTAIGRLLGLAQKLEESEKFDAAAEVVFKIAKMSGWVGPESTVNVFGELKDSDLRAIRESLERKQPIKVVN